MYDFDYLRPTTVADAVALLAQRSEAKFLAGGQTLLPTLKQRLAQPEAVIDLSRIAALQGIREDGDALVIGAMTLHADVAASALVLRVIPALAALAGEIGDRQVRNRGTLGGSISNNDPAADYPGAVLGLGATIETDRRSIAADDFFTGMFETALDPGEIVTSVRFPVPQRAAYRKFPNPASRYATAGVFVARTVDGVRVAVTGAGATVFRVPAIEDALAADFSPAALTGITVDDDGLNSDIHASAAYRAHLIMVLARRAVAAIS
ncbi:MAG: xanthine dehydrogenase family protein subunit M [Azospirillaceae bacterium]|nr:xanthine dehydrogenase family protein subunit M [Azospirillaceae bacterium]